MASGHSPSRRSSSQKQPPPQSEKPTLASNPHNPNSAAYLAYPVKHVVSSLYRRMTEPPDQPVGKLLDAPTASTNSGVYTPPHRTHSPFQPPPLTPLELSQPPSIDPDTLLLTRSLAEEIRLLVPPRLQLVETWRLAYSLEANGSSLATLYEHCADISHRSQRAGYVLIVRDGSASSSSGSVFGAYLTDPPKVSAHYYGTGECFLWRASILPSLRNLQLSANGNGLPPSEEVLELAGLPLPPSADTTHAQRTTTVRAERTSFSSSSPASPRVSMSRKSASLQPPPISSSGTTTPDTIRFKAFPYSGINDFMIFCQPEYLSVGGGDGHYGLWLDDALDNGVSQTSLTFGNEGLSEEGDSDRNGKGRFEVLGVEVWYVGA